MNKCYPQVKHDAVQRGLIGEIISRFEKKGLKILAIKIINPTIDQMEKHYEEHKEKCFYSELIEFSTSGPIVAMVLEGPNAIALCRKLIGSTDVFKSEPGTIRGDFSMTTSRNLIHGSSDKDSSDREISLWFTKDELLYYDKTNDFWAID